jgi:tRNA(Ser,Leu) C12 N-acetylase TAN1
LLEAIERKTEENTALYDAISRIAPAMRTVEFHSMEEFSERLKPVLLEWLPRLTGSSLHVRLHRRGDRHDLPTPDAERSFDDFLLAATGAAGAPCKISFTDPDAVIAIDTVDDRAGVALWSPADRLSAVRSIWPPPSPYDPSSMRTSILLVTRCRRWQPLLTQVKPIRAAIASFWTRQRLVAGTRYQLSSIFLRMDRNMADNLTCTWTGASGKMSARIEL